MSLPFTPYRLDFYELTATWLSEGSQGDDDGEAGKTAQARCCLPCGHKCALHSSNAFLLKIS